VYISRYGPRQVAGDKKSEKDQHPPGRRVYVGKDDIPHPRGGLGIAIISTSNGVLTDRQASKAKVGGEVVCYAW